MDLPEAHRTKVLARALDGAIVAERLVHQRGFHIHEVDEDDYDDAKAAKSVADEVIAKMP